MESRRGRAERRVPAALPREPELHFVAELRQLSVAGRVAGIVDLVDEQIVEQLDVPVVAWRVSYLQSTHPVRQLSTGQTLPGRGSRGNWGCWEMVVAVLRSVAVGSVPKAWQPGKDHL